MGIGGHTDIPNSLMWSTPSVDYNIDFRIR